MTESNLCPVCSDPARDQTTLCVVEESVEAWRIEETGAYQGLYHVLGGVISPLDGVGPDDLTIPGLISRIEKAQIPVREVIIAVSANTEGEATAGYLRDLILQTRDVRISRPAAGLPVGAELAWSDRATLLEAIRSRRAVSPTPSGSNGGAP